MGALGNILDKGMTAFLPQTPPKPTATNLESFLAKFGSASGNWIDTIDPLETFDVKITFFPPSPTIVEAKKDKSGPWTRLGNSLLSSGKDALNNAANNLTGGLLNSFLNDSNKPGSLVEQRKNAKNHDSISFLNYLAKANMLIGGVEWINDDNAQSTASISGPLILQLGPYVQSIIVPQLKTLGEGKSETIMGSFPVNGTFVVPDNNTLTMSVINTKVPLHERIFYPWMKEVTLPYWSYNSQPYTTATIEVDFTKHNDIKYIFSGCRPNNIFLQQPKQTADGGGITRQVSFVFDFMFITSSLSVTDSATSSLFETGKAIYNSAVKMLNM